MLFNEKWNKWYDTYRAKMLESLNIDKYFLVSKTSTVSKANAEKKHTPCKFCKTDLFEDETPCWKCGTNDPTKK
jgi:hypothetical protein